MRAGSNAISWIWLAFCACGNAPNPLGSGPGTAGSSLGGGGGAVGAVVGSAGAQAGDAGGATGGVAQGGEAGGGTTTGGVGGESAAVAPNQATYLALLYELNDLLLSTQIDDATDENDGALVSPSTNPESMPIHSRAAEAVYPLAVAFKHSQREKYAAAAVRLGNWLITVQESNGSWIEEWPAASGWDGTSADQLISLAGAYTILKARLTPQEDAAWVASITGAADWVEVNFPKGNVNYTPTGAVALLSAHRAVPAPKASWLSKAASLMDATLAAVNDETLLTGEGMGVDLGYNIAQSIGMIAMYGRILPSSTHLQAAAALLEQHQYFMYPGGAIDNSWGTRSFKWTLESGTKTAPGVFFSFGLLADQRPSFQRGAQLALQYLEQHGRDAQGWLVYGPHADRHASSSPPSNYGTFARAQSVATVVELGPESAAVGKVPADERNWLKHFSSVETAVLRTEKVMATVTSYGQIGTYARESVARGGSISALWFEGYGSTGFLQVSSQTNYVREESKHMPTEPQLLPLTPRVETITGSYSTNLYDDQAMLAATQDATGIRVTTSGNLRDISGNSSGTSFTWTYDFTADQYTKQLRVSSGSNLRIVEPFVDDTGNQYAIVGADSFLITTAAGHRYQLEVVSSSAPYTLSAGTDEASYWNPFPGLECYPLIITLGGAGEYTIAYTVSQLD